MGLGLALARHFVELHGGTIGAAERGRRAMARRSPSRSHSLQDRLRDGQSPGGVVLTGMSVRLLAVVAVLIATGAHAQEPLPSSRERDLTSHVSDS